MSNLEKTNSNEKPCPVTTSNGNKDIDMPHIQRTNTSEKPDPSTTWCLLVEQVYNFYDYRSVIIFRHHLSARI